MKTGNALVFDSKKQASSLEKNFNILNNLMSSDVSYLNLNKISFKTESCYIGHREKYLKSFHTISYVKKGLISVDKDKHRVVIPEAHYYEFDELLDRSNKISRGYNLIEDFPYQIYWTLQGEHKQTEDWHLFYRIGGFCGSGGIDATSEHSSLYVLSGYEKFQKLEKICQDIMKKEPEFFTETIHTDDMGSYQEKRGNPWKHKPEILRVYPRMPWPLAKELHAFARLIGPLPLPDIKKLRKLMGITEIDETYHI